jgi:hypothetical protein
MMLIGEFLFYFFMEVLMYGLGRLVIPIISFGRARAIRVKEIFSNDRPAYDDNGKMLVPEWAAMMAGVITLAILMTLLAALT